MSDTPNEKPIVDVVVDEFGDPVEYETGTIEELMARLRGGSEK